MTFYKFLIKTLLSIITVLGLYLLERFQAGGVFVPVDPSPSKGFFLLDWNPPVERVLAEDLREIVVAVNVVLVVVQFCRLFEILVFFLSIEHKVLQSGHVEDDIAVVGDGKYGEGGHYDGKEEEEEDFENEVEDVGALAREEKSEILNQDYNDYYECDIHGDEKIRYEEQKVLPVLKPHAVVDPGTVMVHV